MNIEHRIKDPLSRFMSPKNCLLIDDVYCGLTASIKQVSEEGKVNDLFSYYDVSVNNTVEDSKIRDLYFARKAYNR